MGLLRGIPFGSPVSQRERQVDWHADAFTTTRFPLGHKSKKGLC